MEKILDDPSTSSAIKNKVEAKIEKLKYGYNNEPYYHPLSAKSQYSIGAGQFATPKKLQKEYGYGREEASERKELIKDKFYSKGIDPNTRKPGRFNMKESVDNLKLEIYESCHAGEITELERDLLLSQLY